jgi:ferritin-like protein
MTAIEDRPLEAHKPITTVKGLRTHLYHAAQLELSTIPLYLYAAYSIQTQSYSQWAPGMSAFRAIRSVVIEEMLHLCLVRNLMVAIGGGDELTFYDKTFVPTYPSPMLHRIPKLMLGLSPVSEKLMRDMFMPLEKPARTDAPPEPNQYRTIGQFYAAIKDGFERLSGPRLWAHNRPDLQYQDTYWNQDGGGSPIVVCDLPSALSAISTIVEQGEGAAPGDEDVPISPTNPIAGETELSHYAKFKRIAENIDQLGTVWPVPDDPTLADYSGTQAEPLAKLFNAAFSYVLIMIDALYNTSRETVQPDKTSSRYGLERTFVAAMGGLLFPIAALLTTIPLPDGHHAAPTFEYYPFAETPSKKDQLAAMCDNLLGKFPSLGGDNGVRSLIKLLPVV